jgi:DNA (cytosine-5)-methyltransferase 1
VRFGSVCSGIEAASVAWGPLGWKAAWFSEIEPFPCAVLAHHYPAVPNLGDMTALPDRIRAREVEAPDVLCGGTPCQAFSVSGNRKSLGDARGNLSLIFCEIANAIDDVRAERGDQPAIVFWENVPGVLSTKDNAFGCFLGELAGESCELQPPGGKWKNAGVVLGPKRTVAWIVKDAQYFGVAQRRRRVFVVASSMVGLDPTAILFEFDRLRRDFAPRREPSQNPSEAAVRSVALRGREGGATAGLGDDLAGCLRASGGGGDKPHVLSPICFSSKDYGADAMVDCSPTLRAGGHSDSHANAGIPPAVAYAVQCVTGDITHTLKAEGFDASEDGTGRGQPIIPWWSNFVWRVRRLMPVECERLQGFPDNYTRVPYRKKPAGHCPDGPRYKALGNSWAVPNVRWIGARIQLSISMAAQANDNSRRPKREVA